MESIVPQNDAITSSQPDAVQNIQGARMFDVSPTAFKQSRDTLQPEVDKAALMPAATPAVAETIKEDPEHAAALTPDAEHLNKFEQIMKDVSHKWNNVAGPKQDLLNLNWKKLTNHGNLSDEDNVNLAIAKQQIKDDQTANPDLKGIWGIPGDIAASVADTGLSVWRNKEVIGGITAAETLTGLGLGFAFGGRQWAGVGAKIGFKQGLKHGMIAGFALDAYHNGAASTYGQLDDAKKPDGTPLIIDEQNKQFLSHGVGILSAAIAGGTAVVITKTNPLLARFLKNPIEIVGQPAAEPLRNALIKLGQSTAAMSGAAALQTVISQISDQIGKTAKQDEKGPDYEIPGDHKVNVFDGVINAITNIATNKDNAAGDIARNAVVGAGTNLVLHGFGAVVNKGLGKPLTSITPEEFNQAKDVSPKAPMSLNEAQPPPTDHPMSLPPSPEGGSPNPNPELGGPVTPTSDLHAPESPHKAAVKVLEVQDMVDEAQKTLNKAKVKTLDKPIINKLRAAIVDKYKIPYVFFSKEDLTKFANDDTKAQAVSKMFDPSGTFEAGINASIRVPTQKFLELHDDYPELSEYMRLNPEGPSPDSAKMWHGKLMEDQAKQALIMDKLGVLNDTTPEDRTKDLALNTDMSTEEITHAIGTKEAADAYITRLDKNTASEQRKLKALEKTPDPEKQAAITEQLAKIEHMKQKVAIIKDALPKESAAKATMRQALETPQPTHDVFGEEDYLNQPTITDAIRTVLPDSTIKTIDDATMDLRKRVVNNLKDAQVHEMNQVIDTVVEQGKEAEAEMQAQRLENHPGLAIVERFYNGEPKFGPSAGELKAPHHKGGFTAFAIDPRFLEDNQKHYLESKQLKSHKVFVKGGITPDRAASLVGLRDGDALLKLLSETPTRKEVVENRVKQREASIREEAEASVDLNETSMIKGLRERAKHTIKDMELLLDLNPTAAKKGYKVIALRLPRIGELTNKAEHAVEQTKVGELNVNQFKVGDRKSHRIAVNAVLKWDLVTAFVNKEAQALNIELTAATHVAIGEVNRDLRFINRMSKKRSRKIFAEAGKDFQNARDEILDHFNFKKSQKATELDGAYREYVAQQIELGNGDFKIPDRLSDTRLSYREMTVEQLLEVGSKLRMLEHQAKLKNKLYNKYDSEKKTHDLDVIAQDLVASSKLQPRYNEKSKEFVPTDKLTGKLERLLRWSADTGSLLKGLEHILVNADGGQVAGPYHRAIMPVLKGIADYTGQGAQGEGEDLRLLETQLKKIIHAFNEEAHKNLMNLGPETEWFGQTAWDKMSSEVLEIPEWKDNELLNYGKRTRADLLVMMFNRGNEGNTTRMAEGWKTDMKTIEQVLDRHLEPHYAKAAQRMMDAYGAYKKRSFDHEEKQTGIRPKETIPIPWVHRNKVYPGGHWPLMSDSEFTVEALSKKGEYIQQLAEGKQPIQLKNQFDMQNMTKHSYTKDRTGSKEPITLQIASITRAFTEVIHDVNYRLPIADALKILSHPEVRDALLATIGRSELNAIFNTLKHLSSGSVAMQNDALFNQTKPLQMMRNYGRSGLATAVLVGTGGPVAIQPLSLIYAIRKMNKAGSGHKHVQNILTQMTANPTLVPEMYRQAGEIYAPIKEFQHGLDDNAVSSISKLLPKERFSNATAAANAMRDAAKELGFKTLGQVDQFQKVLVVLASYSQFIHGDVNDYPLDVVMKMSPEQRHHEASVYATSMARLTLTAGDQIDRSEFQRAYPELAMFHNDGRNAINNILQDVRDVKGKFKDGLYRDTAFEALGLIMFLGVAKLTNDILRNNKTPINKKHKDLKSFAQDWGWYLGTSIVQVPASEIPVIREAAYKISRDVTKKPWRESATYMFPETKILSDLTNAVETGLIVMHAMKGKIDREHWKSTAMTASYVTGGLPISALVKLHDALSRKHGGIFSKSAADEYLKTLKEFKQEGADNVAPEVNEALDEVADKLEPFKTSGPVDKTDEETKD